MKTLLKKRPATILALVIAPVLIRAQQRLPQLADSIRRAFDIPELGFALIKPDTVPAIYLCGYHRSDRKNIADSAKASDYFHLGWQGYAYEAAKATLDYGIEKPSFTDIHAMTAVDNAGSRRILEKLGFRLEEIFAYDGPSVLAEAMPVTWYKLGQNLPSQKSSLSDDFSYPCLQA